MARRPTPPDLPALRFRARIMLSRRKAIGLLLEGLNTLGCAYFGNYVFFLLQQQHGFGNRENLLVGALHGLIYVPAAWIGGHYAKRHGLA